MRALRLLFVNYEYPPLGGGAGNATAHLGKELAALGAEVTVLTSAFRGLADYERTTGLAVRRVPVVRRRVDRCTPPEMATFVCSATVAALRLARRMRPDVTVTFFGIPSGPVGLALKLAYGIPYLVSLRGGDVPGFQPYDLALYHRLLGGTIRSLWRRSAGVVANSDGLKALVQQSAPHQPVLVIPNGVDVVRFRPPETRGEDPAVRIGFVGRLVHQKGVDVLMQAVALLEPELPFVIDIVGDGAERQELRSLAANLGVEDRVRFLGWKAGEELPELYRRMDAFVLPSRDEGMPNVVLEAMASGLPVVATRVAGTEELVCDGKTGLIVPPEDHQALAAALRRTITDGTARTAMGAAGRRLVEARYTWRRVAEEYLALAESCVARECRRRGTVD
ncbi:MAG: glycosyltransferase family 4 protein [Desulfomonile sp.]|nr:glycosyltransferase family 4 protein [Desulfomonile sp.]